MPGSSLWILCHLVPSMRSQGARYGGVSRAARKSGWSPHIRQMEGDGNPAVPPHCSIRHSADRHVSVSMSCSSTRCGSDRNRTATPELPRDMLCRDRSILCDQQLGRVGRKVCIDAIHNATITKRQCMPKRQPSAAGRTGNAVAPSAACPSAAPFA
jgi:hypothetical protein